VKDVLHSYERALGQCVNYNETDVLFSKGVGADRRNAITLALDIREVLSYEKYLGLLTFISRSKRKPFLFIMDRIKKHLAGFMERLVSWARREVLIKVVAQAIPSYAMSIFSFTKDLCNTIQATINRFWWGHKQEDRSKIEGGIGFRDMKSFNKALLAKQLWSLITHPSSLVSQVLGAKYFPNGPILDATLGPR